MVLLLFVSSYSQSKSKQSDSLFIDLECKSFVRNNEYFSNIAEGYTLIGAIASPELVYKFSKAIKLALGVHMLKYSGQEKLNSVNPYLSLSYQMSWKNRINIGRIKSKHFLSEQLYNPELEIIDDFQSGIQFIHHSTNLKSDNWISWEKFIEHGDPFQEEFMFGSSNYLFLKTSDKYDISFPIALTIFHRGGQIDDSGKSMQTLLNYNFGIWIEKDFDMKKSFSISAKYFAFQDLSPEKQLPYSIGYGVNEEAIFIINNLHLILGAWQGNRFYAPKGMPLFLSFDSNSNYYYTESKKNLITGGFEINKKILNKLDFSFYTKAYFDIDRNSTDYYYGISFSIKPEFWLY